MPSKKQPETGFPPAVWLSLIVGSLTLAVAVFFLGVLMGWQYPITSMTDDVVVLEDDVADDEDMEEMQDEDVDFTVIDSQETLEINWIPVDQQEETDLLPSFSLAWYSEAKDDHDGYGVNEQAAFELGTVIGGTYDDYKLMAYFVAEEGLGVTNIRFYILIPPKGVDAPYVFIDEAIAYYSTPTYRSDLLARQDLYFRSRETKMDILADDFVFLRGAELEGLEPPEQLVDTDGIVYDQIQTAYRYNFPEDAAISGYQYVADTDQGSLYRVGSDSGQHQNLFFYIREDGAVIYYLVHIPFLTPDESSPVPYFGTLNVNWIDGRVHDARYVTAQQGKCGYATLTNVVDIDEIGELTPAGTYAVGGETGTVYMPVSYAGNAYFEDKANALGFFADSDIAAYGEIMAFLYWQDAFGRWIEFTNEDVMLAAECGKPVIYLYPEEVTDMEVYVHPQSGFTYTEPVYADGWRVTAYPDGTIVNRDDGQVYPYLFWEGRGGEYSSPEEYWVVAQADVKAFIYDMMGQFGFVQHEIDDFAEFWLPRMTDAAYYKIGFHGNAVMDEIAPLEVTGQPDSVLRILMDFEELEAPIAENPPAFIPPFERGEGFVVTEWGGVIH